MCVLYTFSTQYYLQMYITCQKCTSDRQLRQVKKSIDNQYVHVIPPRLKERKCHDLLHGSHLHFLSRGLKPEIVSDIWL